MEANENVVATDWYDSILSQFMTFIRMEENTDNMWVCGSTALHRYETHYLKRAVDWTPNDLDIIIISSMSFDNIMVRRCYSSLPNIFQNNPI